MSRKFIATVLAAAIAVTGLAVTPAKADNRDVARALAAIATIAIIAKTLDDSNSRKRDAYHPHATPPHAGNRPHPQPHAGHRPHPQPHRPATLQPRPLPDRLSNRALPRDCLFSVNTRRGEERVFGKRCLTQTYRSASHLPRACEMQLRDKGRTRDVYTASCLRDYGYTLARR